MKNWIIKWFMGGIVRDIAEGKRGPRAYKVYWAMQGRKTYTSIILGILFAAFAFFQPDIAKQWAPTILPIIGFCVTAGLVDKEWRNSLPPVAWKEALAAIMAAGPAISAVFVVVANLVAKIPGCESCEGFAEKANYIAGAVAAATAWLAARFSPPPFAVKG